MFAIYQKVITILNYPQEFDATSDLWDCEIDELAGFIAQADSIAEPVKFFAECDLIDEVLESLGYEI